MEIRIDHGNPSAEDISRARREADRYLREHSISTDEQREAAYALHREVIERTGDAQGVWSYAESLANFELTRGWAGPDGAACSLYP